VTAAGAPSRQSALWRALTTPFGPRILPRFVRLPERARYRELIIASGLPGPAAEIVRATVARTRLWRGEQIDVARELVAHFTDGLEAGRATESLIGEFGDPADAAALIRRAKKRARPAAWKAWVWAWRGAGAMVVGCILMYAVLAARFMTGSPRVTRDIAAEISEPPVPGAERAWPLYQDAAQKMGLQRGEAAVLWSRSGAGDAMPGDELWPQLESSLEAWKEPLDTIRQGASRAALGKDLEYFYEPTSADPSTRPLLDNLNLREIGTMGYLSRVLQEDAILHAFHGDGNGTTADLTALLGLADQCAHAGRQFLHGMTALRLVGRASACLGRVLAVYPSALRDDDLVRLAHAFGSFDAGAVLRSEIEGERLMFIDVVQRVYTDDGSGSGRMTRAGWERLQDQSGITTVGFERRALALRGPLDAATGLGRREVLAAFDRAMAAALDAGSGPMGLWPADPTDRALHSLDERERADPFLQSSIPAYGMLMQQGQVAMQKRDAVLVAIALELHRRAHGSYPQTLDALSPRLLPSVPIDRFDGRPIKYTLRDGRPLLYSVATDRADDGGKVRPGPNGNNDAPRYFFPWQRRIFERAARPPTPLPGYDWILWPPIDYDGDGTAIERRPASR
jgi:hypothetical protein